MYLSDFDYPVTETLIAKYPLNTRDSSRIFVLHKNTGRFEHRIFSDIINYLHQGDVLVLNDTKVVPVRLHGNKPSGGTAEITLIKESGKNSWEAIVKGLHEGTIFLGHGIEADISRLNGTIAKAVFRFNSNITGSEKVDIRDFIHKIGSMPLPPYIKRKADKADINQYQTIYAKKEGAIAAPTAGLHFTRSLLKKIKEKGIGIRTITLHVGYGTFKPVKVSNFQEHRMDEELYEIPLKTARAVNDAKRIGRRIIAVGTTVTRTLESSAADDSSNRVMPGRGKTDIFIYPGYRFRVIDALITNFHLPKSTPMIMASAFAGLETLKNAYRTAHEEKYRLFSYGDAMLII